MELESSSIPIPPFLSETPMQGDPPCDWADFLSPQLRRFPRAYNKVTMRNRLGHGIEGCVVRVKFDDDKSSFALKIFFHALLDGDRANSWWPLEREARNVAVLEKIQAGIRQSSPKPIHVPAKRTTRLDCLRCLYAFSADGRRSRDFDALPDDSKVAVSESDTRLRKCFGWTRVQGADFMRMNSIIKVDEYARRKGEGSASYLESDAQYYAIVYEYVPKAKLEFDPVQSQLDFFYRIGFHPCQGMHEVNWQGPGILLDFGDYNSPVDPWFKARCAYHKHTAAEYIIDRKKAQAESSAEWNRINNLRHQGIGPTEEEKRKREKEKAQSDTARFVEYGYDEHQRYLSYFELTNEEILERKLEQDPLSQIRINEIEPETVLRAWKTYKKQKKKYLVAFERETETKEA
ncbi:hypothetical protein F5144DRAFT_583213 [Chaetomium tenue]|uniref:Uncharacterized protein n=1 Tax=Chaetomium tenue TaxID=1854479 RepID=A0ACB7NYM5_9PEZI|nr:hypothetical protein F5144DRAFT_583213 [Chaetomium globosum]